LKEEQTRQIVRDRYGKFAQKNQCCCGCNTSNSEKIGYSKEELGSIPQEANLNLGCGNPLALASLKEGETVVDLGSGGGIDCFLASKKVGATGKVIGVDMTPQMLDRARANLKKAGYTNVEFRLGEIENLPVADNTADIIISNCVINLSPNKPRVFQEAFRVLKPKGRLMISDMVVLKDLPEKIKTNVLALIGCVAGAEKKEAYLELLRSVGFKQVTVVSQTSASEAMIDEADIKEMIGELNLSDSEVQDLATSVVSIKVSAVKP
jgi:ubiquinone/menaquinone biosynthesis C-methylase UbiE